MARVRKLYAVGLGVFLIAGQFAFGQAQTQDLDGLADAAADLAEEYFDPEFLNALNKGDREVVERFLGQVNSELGSRYVLDLADLEETAAAALKIMERYEETYPYAAWLKPRLDYFKVAKRLKTLTPAPTPVPGKEAPAAVPVPSAGKERETWAEQIKKEPVPPRARTYVDDFKKVFREQKVPPELIWLAEVESSFDAKACSPAGAAGMFQLMPVTARRFGLGRFPFDERYRPVPSATAAAKYLRYLYGKFKDWRLALAAYNSGEGTVGRLLEKEQTKSYDAIAGKLPAETQLYVPKVEATVFRREGVKLHELDARAPELETGH